MVETFKPTPRPTLLLHLAFCKLTTILPYVVEALMDPYFTTPEDTPEDTPEGNAREYAAEQTLKGTLHRLPPAAKKLTKTTDDITENICLGKLTPEESVAKAAAEWTRVMSEKGSR